VAARHDIGAKTRSARYTCAGGEGSHLKELVWLPHPCRQALERDVHSWDRLAAEELRLVNFEHGQRDAE